MLRLYHSTTPLRNCLKASILCEPPYHQATHGGIDHRFPGLTQPFVLLTQAEKIVWGSRYLHQGTTSAWDAIQTLMQARVDEPTIARMLGGNAAEQFGVKLVQKVGA
ncbi:MAG: hypothetical protein ACRERD_09935 [Candidatus Binatia bacterium]